MPRTREKHEGLRDMRHEAIALAAASGKSCKVLADQFDMTYSGMQNLLDKPVMQERIQVARERLHQATVVAQTKILLNLSDMVEREIKVALPAKFEDSLLPVSQKARHYLIDRVMPVTTKAEVTTTHELTGVMAEVATEVRDLLVGLSNAQASRRRSILDSPHVLEGERAIPKALEQGKND